jgi:glycosyltransferase involved in cell wall biosynthesis
MAHLRTAFVSTFPPRKCGLATFTADLMEAIAGLGTYPEPVAVAISHADSRPQYDNRVKYEIIQEEESSYLAAAAWLNQAPVDVVMVEHEYGIFGGTHGNYILKLLKHLKKPALVTLHTILPRPDRARAEIMRSLATNSEGLVALAYKGRDLLVRRYGIPEEKIYVIRHGVPEPPAASAQELKEKYQVTGRTVLCTFGLLHPGKGIEYVLEGLPQVVRQYPDTLYLVLGQTHPEVKKHSGEAYREYLQGKVDGLGLTNHVRFVNHYLSQEELMEYLALTDIYITPYLDPEQISSGPLAYAVALGKAVVSTPYLCARELLARGRGMLVPFKDSAAMEEALLQLLSNPARRAEMAARAGSFGKTLSWSAVARSYLELMEQAVARASAQREPAGAGR